MSSFVKQALVALGLAVLIVAAPAAQADQSATQSPPAKTTPAKTADQQDRSLTLQQKAFETYQDLRSAMRRLQKELAASDKEKAQRLKAGLVLLREKRVETAMKEIETLLKDESWDMALENMKKVQTDLHLLLNLLMDRDVDLQDILEEIARLENYKGKVEQLIKEQTNEKKTSAQAERLEKQLRAIEQAKADVKKLIAEQEALKASTADKGTGAKDSDGLANRQGELQEDAENLEADLKDIEARDRAIAAAKTKAGKPGEGKPGKGKCSACAGKASESMGKSKKKLGDKQPESSLDDQDDAIEGLKEAEKKLSDLEEEARARLMELPFETFAREQLKTMQKTKDLAAEMEKDEAGKSDGKGEGEDGPAGKKSPGKQNIQQAVPKQKNAAGSLKEYKAGKAKPKQQDAKDDLEQARKKLEDALAQLRQELQEEVLRALEERFTEMLSKQKELTRSTVLTQAWRARVEALVKSGVTPTQVKSRCRKIADGESGLKQMALDALTLIESEGTSAVFPEIVKSLAEDLGLAARMIDGYDTGEDTQAGQKQIEKTLAQLIEALTKQIDVLNGEGGGP